jgi:RNA polymerase sporulation-specific sigma factor
MTRQALDQRDVRLAQAGDRDAAERILARYEPAVLFAARGFYVLGEERADMQQEARRGLWKAVLTYREGRGTTFRTHASLSIRRQMITAVKSTRGQRQGGCDGYGWVQPRSPEWWATHEQAAEGADPAAGIVGQVGAARLLRALGLSTLETAALRGLLRGDSYGEMAATLGRDPKVLDNALTRVRRKAKRVLTHEEATP